MASGPPEPAAAEFDLRPAWRLDDAQIEADAIDFWRRLHVLPPGTLPEQRAKELVAVAYKDGALVAVATGIIDTFSIVRAQFVVMRAAVASEHRRGGLGTDLVAYGRALIERWSEEHPEERVAGIAGIVEAPELFEIQKVPFWAPTRLAVAGYMPDGRQIRISWFEKFRLD